MHFFPHWLVILAHFSGVNLLLHIALIYLFTSTFLLFLFCFLRKLLGCGLNGLGSSELLNWDTPLLFSISEIFKLLVLFAVIPCLLLVVVNLLNSVGKVSMEQASELAVHKGRRALGWQTCVGFLELLGTLGGKVEFGLDGRSHFESLLEWGNFLAEPRRTHVFFRLFLSDLGVLHGSQIFKVCLGRLERIKLANSLRLHHPFFVDWQRLEMAQCSPLVLSRHHLIVWLLNWTQIHMVHQIGSPTLILVVKLSDHRHLLLISCLRQRSLYAASCGDFQRNFSSSDNFITGSEVLQNGPRCFKGLQQGSSCHVVVLLRRGRVELFLSDQLWFAFEKIYANRNVLFCDPCLPFTLNVDFLLP